MQTVYLPPPAAPRPQASFLELGDGPRAISTFVAAMQRFKSSPQELAYIRGVALELVHAAAPYAETSEVGRLFEYVRDGVRYVKDVVGVDTLQTPTVTLELGQGDCDDKSLLLAALLESIGYPARFVVSATNPGGGYNHVYVEAWLSRLSKWIPLESSVTGMPAGRELPSFLPPQRYP